jgi:hypothetical protein
MRHGLVNNHLLNNLECLVVNLMHVFQCKIGVSWIIKLKRVYVLVIKMV